MTRCPSQGWFKAIAICAFFLVCTNCPTKVLAQSSSVDTSPNLAPSRTVSLKASFDQAFNNNKEVIAAKYNVDISKAAIRIAGAVPNPRFNLQYGWGPAFEIIIAGNPQQFGFQNQLRTGGTRTKLINFARANFRTSELQVAALLFDIHNRVRRAYAELAAAEAYSDLIESERKVAIELLKTTVERFLEGKVAQSDEFQARLGVLQFETQRLQAQARLQVASSALSLITGEVPKSIEVIDVDDNGLFKLSADRTDLVPPPNKVLPPLEQLFPVAFSERPDLKVAIQQKFADRRALSVARAQRIPDLFIDTGYQFTTFKKQQPYGLFPGTVRNSPGCYINASFEVPIFYQHQGETSQAKEVLLQDYEQISQLEWQIATDVVTSYEAVAVARANITKYQRDLLPSAAKVSRLARRSYEEGKTDLATAILAKQQYQQILTSYFDAVVTYQTSWADLEKAMGVPLKL